MQTMTREEYEKKYGVPPPTSLSQSSVQSGSPLRTMTRTEYNETYGMQKSEPFRFDVPELEADRQNRIARYKQEALELQKEADKYTGLSALWKYPLEMGKFLLPGTTNTSGLAGKIRQTGNLEGYVEAQKMTEDMKATLIRRVRELEDQGQDATKYKQLFNVYADDSERLSQKIKETGALPSTLKASASIAMMAIEGLSFGTYGSSRGATAGMQSFKLAPKFSTLPTAIQGMRNMANAPKGIFTKKGLTRIAEGGLFGYAYDIALGLSGERGPEREGASAFTPGVVTAIGLGLPFLIAGSRTLRNIFTKGGRESVTIERRTEALNQLERDNKAVRDAFNDYRQRYQKDPTNMLASSDALNNAVDKQGTITMTPAIRALREIINNEDKVIGRMLVQEGTSLSVPQLTGELFAGAGRSRLEFADQAKLIKEVKKVADSMRYSADSAGKVPLWKVHQQKINLGMDIAKGKKWAKPGADRVNKAFYDILKTIVEENTQGIDVKKHNWNLSEAYAFENILKMLNGKKVEGGRLGKHVASGVGALIGASTGSPLLTIAGSRIGPAIKGQQLKRAFGGKVGRPFVKASPVPKKTPTVKKKKVDTIKKRGLVTKLKEKVAKERAELRSMVRQTGKKGSAGGKGAQPEPIRKLTVNASDVTVNERMQIIDETKTGADALLGTVGNLSPELRQSVIVAVKAKDQSTLNKLIPRILDELNAKAQRQPVSSELSEEALQRRLVGAQNSQRVQLPVAEKLNKQLGEAVALQLEGKTKEADAKFMGVANAQLEEFKNRLKKVGLFKDGEKSPVRFLSNRVGFKISDGQSRPSFDVSVSVNPEKQEAFMTELTRISDELGLERIDSYQIKPTGEGDFGAVGGEVGLSNTPHYVGFLKKPLTTAETKIIREAQEQSGLAQVNLSDGGSRIDIPFTMEYNQTNHERFIQQFNNFDEALKSKGVVGVYQQGASQTRTLTRNASDQGGTFNAYQSAFYRKNPDLVQNSVISSKVVDRLRYTPSITKGEFMALLDELPITALERKFYESALKGKKDDALVSTKGLFKKVEKRGLKTRVRKVTRSTWNWTDAGHNALYQDGKDRSSYALFVDATDIKDPNSRLKSHGGADGFGIVGHARISMRKGTPIVKGSQIVGFKKDKGSLHNITETQFDPFQEGSGGWSDRTKGFLENLSPETRRASLKAEIDSDVHGLTLRKNRLDELRSELDNFNDAQPPEPVPTTGPGKAVYEAKKLLSKITEWARENNLPTQDSPWAPYISIIEGLPDENVWRVKIKYRTAPNEPLLDHTIDLPARWGIGAGEGQASSFRHTDIDIWGEGGNHSSLALEKMIQNTEQTYSLGARARTRADIANDIGNLESEVSRAEASIKDKRREFARVKGKENLAVEQYGNLKEGAKYIRRLLSEIVPYMRKMGATHLTLPTLSSIIRVEGYRPSSSIYERLIETRQNLIQNKRSVDAPAYRYWMGGKEGKFGQEGRQLNVTERIQPLDSETTHTVLKADRNHILTIPNDKVTLKTQKMSLVKARQKNYADFQNAFIRKINKIKTDQNLGSTVGMGDVVDDYRTFEKILSELWYKDFITSRMRDNMLFRNYQWDYRVRDYVPRDRRDTYGSIIYSIYASLRKKHGAFGNPLKVNREALVEGVGGIPYHPRMIDGGPEAKYGYATWSNGYLHQYSFNHPAETFFFKQPENYVNPENPKDSSLNLSVWDAIDNMDEAEIDRLGMGENSEGVLKFYRSRLGYMKRLIEEATGNTFERVIDDGFNSQSMIKLNDGVKKIPYISFDDIM